MCGVDDPLPCSSQESPEDLATHMQSAQISHAEVIVSRITKLETAVGSMQSHHSPPRVSADGITTTLTTTTTTTTSGNTDSGLGQSLGSSLGPSLGSRFGTGSGRFEGDFAERDNIIKKSGRPVMGGDSDRALLLAGGGNTGSTGGSGAQSSSETRQEVEFLRKELRAKSEEITSLRVMINKLEKTQRAKNADFEDRDFRLSLIENSNYDGTMVWKIPQFNQRMTDAQSGKYTSIFSLPFYSGRYGYKMCLRLYILGDGIGKGNYMSLFFVLMKGEFDNILQWPFTNKVTFKLINQGNGRDVVDTFQPDPMSSSFRKPKSDMNIASGCPRFVSHTDLHAGGYIVEDTVFIKCIVDTSAIRHP